MGTSTFLALNTGLSALQSSQMGIQITGNNISNAQTAGYARETLNQSEAPALQMQTDHVTYLGTGVMATNAQRVSDQYVNAQYRYNNSKESYWNQMNTELSNLQQVYNEPAGGAVSTATNAFFSAWNQLSQTPNDNGARSAVLQSANNLVAAFGQVSNALQNDAARYQAETSTAVSQVNSLAQSIASLNTKIQQAREGGDAPNSLLDQRSALLDQLSQYVQLNVTTSNNADTVTAVTSSGTGIQLVAGSQTTALTTADIPNLTPASGKVTAYNDLYQKVSGTGGLLSQLNSLETQITNDVNAGQAAGYDANGNPGSAMFQTVGGTIEVNPALTISGIAASGVSGSSTDGSNALAISNLAQQNGYLQTYSADLTQLGAEGSSAQSNYTTFNALLTQAKAAKTSISGVDINQEMANMVQYQQTYSAASKYISVFNNMLTTLIQNV